MAINNNECPRCGSRNSADIRYGLPTLEAIEQAEAGEISLRGCLEEPGNTEYRCRDCEHEWNVEEAVDDAYERVNWLKASVGGYFGKSYEVEIDFNEGSLTWSCSEQMVEVDRTVKRDPSLKCKRELKTTGLFKWKSTYVEPGVMDGTSWSVELIGDGRNIRKSGQNKYPAGWNRFCDYIRRVTGKEFS
ncbi:hypothetical protein [Alteribacter natronophilus]|uniref:hypothetical protein n=1 Tax=Alteribacter natronophilus TaxID=2583810 RepID=UPI001AEE8EFD|nr:hypothetical protein [Alteribacter natronophilus]